MRIVGHDVPGDARILVGQGDDGLVEATPLDNWFDPARQWRVPVTAPVLIGQAQFARLNWTGTIWVFRAVIELPRLKLDRLNRVLIGHAS